MNILLVYPKYPETFWSFTHALKFISKKAAVPPLGLLTVSAMLPKDWNKKLVDLNVTNFLNSDVMWADFVFISAMYVQRASVEYVINECKKNQVKIVAGGPLFTQDYDHYPQIDHFILNEAEITLPLFLEDVQMGNIPKRIYQTDAYADLSLTPVPDYHLLDMKAYASMDLQVSRGCPFACDFCEITALLGRKVRFKKPYQVLEELETLYKLKWRGAIAIVDDNFIGKFKYVKATLLPAIKSWMQEHSFPFSFTIQASINLSDDTVLMQLMREAGFNSAFIGIETPDTDSLQSCSKKQNKKRDLLHCIKKIQEEGLQVSAGFIVGFDSDTPSIFQRQINFIQKSGIVTAMVGLLNAPKNTRLFKRLENEKRITEDATGSNTDYTMNFRPLMDKTELLEGYRKIIVSIYSIKPFYKRIRKYFENYIPQYSPRFKSKISFTAIEALFKSFIIIGIANKGRGEYWKLVLWTIFHKPRFFFEVISFTVYGYHYRKIYGL